MLKTKLTEPQWKMLDRVCRSNGGGVFAGFNEQGRETKLLRKLESMGLVQGKAGDAAWAVHTHEGLAFWREHRADGT